MTANPILSFFFKIMERDKTIRVGLILLKLKDSGAEGLYYKHVTLRQRNCLTRPDVNARLNVWFFAREIEI